MTTRKEEGNPLISRESSQVKSVLEPDSNSDDKHKPTKPKTTMQLLGILAIWFIASILNTYFNRQALLRFDISAPALTLSCQVFTVILGFLLIRLQNVGGITKLTREQFVDLVLPLGLTWGCTSVFYNLAMTSIPVSFLNTVKSSIPLWTCLICRTWMGTKFSMLTYIALVPLFGGVIIATLSEIGFTTFGFVVACFSALSNTLFNIFAKRALNHPSKLLDHQSCQFYTAICCIILIGPIWLFGTSGGVPEDIIIAQPPDATGNEDALFVSIDWSMMGILTITGCVYYTEILAAYALIASVASLGFSISDVVRRLVVIISSVFMFGNQVSSKNALGICVAMSGVMLYNISRSQDTMDRISEWYSCIAECLKRSTRHVALMKKTGDLPIPKIVTV